MSVPHQLPVPLPDPRRAVGLHPTTRSAAHRPQLGRATAWKPGEPFATIDRSREARAPRNAPLDPDTTRDPRPGCRPGGCARLCNTEGLAVAYRACWLPLLGRARAILRDAALAEDAVQETFIRAWRACATFDPDGPPMLNWLSVIMRNIALDLLKARGRRPRLLRSEPIEHAAPPTRTSDVDLMLLRNVLANALAGIGVQHRTAIVETILLDRPYEEVAAELGVPVGTLRSRVHYALRRLRLQLQADDDQHPRPPGRDPGESGARQQPTDAAPADQAEVGRPGRLRRAA